MEQQARYAVEHRHARPDSEQVSRPVPAAAFADNRPGTVTLRNLAAAMDNSPNVVAQRKLGEALNNSPRVAAQRKLAETYLAPRQSPSQPAQLNALAYAPGSDTQVAPGHAQIVAARQSARADFSTQASRPIPIQRAKKNKRIAVGAGLGAVAGGLGLGALAIANAWNPIGWGLVAAAGLGALVGGITGALTGSDTAPQTSQDLSQTFDDDPQTLEDLHGYDTDDLAGENLSDAEEERDVVRYYGKKNQKTETLKVFSPDIAMKRAARNIRNERKGTAQDKDRKPFLTRIGSSLLEYVPSSMRKDVGAYQTEELPSGELKRSGNAKPYGQLGKDLDRMGIEEKRSGPELDAYMQDLLLGRTPSQPLASKDSRKLLAEGAGILLTDMARGSAGTGLVSNMLSAPESFGNRFRDETGSYKPAHKGGSQYIQEETRKKKNQ